MVLEFGSFQLDVATCELREEGKPVRLQPQPVKVLALLASNAGSLVTRERIRSEIWSGDTFVDFDRGLNYCIAQIRDALGDSASEPTFVETLPRRGYRFIAPLRESQNGIADGLQGGTPANSVPIARSIDVSAPVAIAAVAVVVALIAGASMLMLRRDAVKAKPDTRVRLAVVPFDNETGVAEYDRLAQTLTDATVARLAADPSRLAVVGNALALRVPRSQRDLEAIGRSLGVGHVVLGQVQQIDGHLRVTTHLIRTTDQSHLWAKRFEPSPSETVHLDREVSEAVAVAVTKRLLGG